MTEDEQTPPPPPVPTITVVPSTPIVTWQLDFARVVTYNVSPLSAGERALLNWYRLPWWKRWATRQPRETGPELTTEETA